MRPFMPDGNGSTGSGGGSRSGTRSGAKQIVKGTGCTLLCKQVSDDAEQCQFYEGLIKALNKVLDESCRCGFGYADSKSKKIVITPTDGICPHCNNKKGSDLGIDFQKNCWLCCSQNQNRTKCSYALCLGYCNQQLKNWIDGWLFCCIQDGC